MDNHSTLAIIGGGPSALFTLFHIHQNSEILRQRFSRILIFEREKEVGPGMPYSRVHTSGLNLSNISSEELPRLPETFAAWLEAQTDAQLARLAITKPIQKSEIYPRVALGDYFKDQFATLVKLLMEKRMTTECHTGSEVSDLIALEEGGYDILTAKGDSFRAGTVLIATGHVWDRDVDGVNLSSPWPIGKLLPSKQGELHNFPIGLLGASLSSVDVVNVLAHHHGTFREEDDMLVYTPSPGADHFRLVMHSADGLLSHLQFEQDEPKRELYRHCKEDELQKLITDGHLRVSGYFNEICRPALVEALREDGMQVEAAKLEHPSFSFEDFADMMKKKHLSPNPFELMETEFGEERKKIRRRKSTRWKEVLDDLMYTLNFHAQLLPAEDHVELKSRILPFVMNVMAALPLKSAKILIAVYNAGRLELISGKAQAEHTENEPIVRVRVSDGDEVQTYEYRMFIDCAGQSPVCRKSFPFRSLVESGMVTPAVAYVLSNNSVGEIDEDKIQKTSDGQAQMQLGGMAVTENYQLISKDGNVNEGLYDIAVPHIAGLRPYCYGLQACNEAAKAVVEHMLQTNHTSLIE